MNNPINFTQKDKLSPNDILDMDFFTGNKSLPTLPVNTDGSLPASKTKKRGRPATKTKKMNDGSEIILADQEDSNLHIFQSNEPYINSYGETNDMLKTSVAQIDVLQVDIKSELDQIRASKTLKKKFDYISMLSTTMASLIGTKVTAIREMNKTITDSHNLDIKRIKDLKMSENQQDDDKHIMDMYNAFISTPVGNYNPLTGLTPAEMNSASGIVMANTVSGGGDIGYNNYMNTLSPEQNMMLLEGNPDIRTVVVYNPSTGDRYFDVMNLKTGESIPNTPKPDRMFLEDTNIDVSKGIAYNANIDTSYTLITLGGNPNILEY